MPDEELTLLAGVLITLDDGLLNERENIIIEAPDDVIEPIVILQGPDMISICESLVIDAYASQGSGGRDFEYAWLVESDTGVSVENYSLGPSNETLTLDSKALTSLWANGTTSVVVALTLRNFLGGSGSGEKNIVLVNESIPTLRIVGGSRRQVPRAPSFVMRATAVATTCDGGNTSVEIYDYVWTVVDEEALVSTSNDPRELLLSPYSFDVGVTYTVVVFPTVGGSSSIATATVECVESAHVVALITGGDVRPVSGVATLSAADSYDPDVDPDVEPTGLSFQCTCLNDANWSQCDAAALLSNSTSSDLIVNSTRLPARSLFSVLVTPSDSASRSDEASVVITRQDDDSAPAVALEVVTREVDRVVVPGEKLAIAGVVAATNVGYYNASWSLVEGELYGGASLREASRTPLVVRYNQSEGSSARQISLVVSPDSLLSGASYTFRLGASAEGSFAIGFAELTVFAATAPSSGDLAVSPQSGFALETAFFLLASLWASDASTLPLLYAYNLDAGRQILRVSALDPAAEVILPACAELCLVEGRRRRHPRCERHSAALGPRRGEPRAAGRQRYGASPDERAGARIVRRSLSDRRGARLGPRLLTRRTGAGRHGRSRVLRRHVRAGHALLRLPVRLDPNDASVLGRRARPRRSRGALGFAHDALRLGAERAVAPRRGLQPAQFGALFRRERDATTTGRDRIDEQRGGRGLAGKCLGRAAASVEPGRG